MLPVYCRNCRKGIKGDVAFCPHCGASQAQPAPELERSIAFVAPAAIDPSGVPGATAADMTQIFVMWGAFALDAIARVSAAQMISVTGVSGPYIIMVIVALLSWITSFYISIRLIQSKVTAARLNGGIVLTLNILGLIIVLVMVVTLLAVPAAPPPPQ